MAGLLDILGQGAAIAGRGLQEGGRLLGGAAQAGGRILGDVGHSIAPPSSQGPADLSDLGGGQRAILGILSAIAASGGQPTAIDQLMARREQQAMAKKKALVDNLAVLDRMRGFLDEVPLAERSAAAGKLRQRYELDFGGPGSGEFFDAVLGDPGSAQGLIGQMGEDPEVAQYLQQPGANAAGLKELAGSPAVRARAIERQDLGLLPGIEQKLGRLLSSQAPGLREAVLEAQKDGQITLEELRRLNDLGGEGPEGTRLTAAELATAERRQGDIAARVPGFKSQADFEEGRKRRSELDDFREKEKIKFQNDLALEAAKAKVKAQELGQGSATPTAQLSFATKVDSVRRAYFQTQAELNTAIHAPLSGTGDITALYNFIARMDDTAAREGELALAQRAASLKDRISRTAGNITDGRLLSDSQRKEIRQALETVQGEIRGLHQDFVKRTHATSEAFKLNTPAILPDYAEFTGGQAAPADAEAPAGPAAPAADLRSSDQALKIRERLRAGEITREQARSELEALRAR